MQVAFDPAAGVIASLHDSGPRGLGLRSAARRSVMSRTCAVNVGGPGTSIRVIVSSTGNRVPSARMASISMRRSSTCGSPLARYLAEPGPVSDTQLGRDDQLGHFSPDGIASSVAKRPLGRRVELDDASTVIHRDDTVERGVERCLVPLRDGLAGGLGWLPLDELPQLHSEQLERREPDVSQVPQRDTAQRVRILRGLPFGCERPPELGRDRLDRAGRGIASVRRGANRRCHRSLKHQGVPGHAQRGPSRKPSRWPARHRAPGRSARPSAGNPRAPCAGADSR